MLNVCGVCDPGVCSIPLVSGVWAQGALRFAWLHTCLCVHEKCMTAWVAFESCCRGLDVDVV